MTFARVARLVAVPIFLGLALAFALLAGGSQHSAGKSALREALDSPGGEQAGEISRTEVEQYWQSRLTYPTGRFDQDWVIAAAKQAKRIRPGIPEGRYRPWRGIGGRSTGAL